MNRLANLSVAYFVVAALALAAQVLAGQGQEKRSNAQKTFTGEIGDAMCGLKHTIANKDARDCTLECVKAGSKFVLADVLHKKVYQLDNQELPEEFAGKRVEVKGTYDPQTNTIHIVQLAQTSCYDDKTCWIQCRGKKKCGEKCVCKSSG